MNHVIYVDILIIVNLFVNYFLILVTSKFLSLKMKKSRFLLGEILGSMYSLFIFLPPMNLFISLLAKLLMSLSIICVVFRLRSLKSVIKTLLCFYAVNFIFLGVMFGLWCIFRPNGMIMNNGMIYFNISPIVLIVSTLVTYILLEIYGRVFTKKITTKTQCSVEIHFDGKCKTINAIVDTGNYLREPFSNFPVIVAKKSSVIDICPQEILKGPLEYIKYEDSYIKNFRIVPFKTVSGEGLLPSFEPDYVVINNGEHKKAYLAICSDEILSNEESGILNPELLN